MTIKILHERWKCIGCGACAAVSPEYWSMADDGKSDLKDATIKKVNEGTLGELSVDKPGSNQDAADACPVSCIIVKQK